jgi:hypothetical protein
MTIQSPFPCPSLIPAQPTADVDVQIRTGRVPQHLDSAEWSTTDWESGPDNFLIRGCARSGRFLVEKGCRVTFQPKRDAEAAMIAVQFVARVLPAVLRQRGLLVIHGNTVLTSGGTVLICGQSGAGKSTTSAAMLGRGDSLVSDDVTALIPGEPWPLVLPGVSQIHLDIASARRVGLDVTDAQLQPWRRMKAAITAPRCVSSAQRLHALIELSASEDDTVPTPTKVSGAAAFALLQRNLYGPTLLTDQHALLPALAMLASQLPVLTLARPNKRWSVAEVLAAVDALLVQ